MKEQKTSAELSSLYQVHPNQIRNWKVQATKGLVDLFIDKRGKEGKDRAELMWWILVDKSCGYCRITIKYH
jgi:transposase-like protein